MASSVSLTVRDPRSGAIVEFLYSIAYKKLDLSNRPHERNNSMNMKYDQNWIEHQIIDYCNRS